MRRRGVECGQCVCRRSCMREHQPHRQQQRQQTRPTRPTGRSVWRHDGRWIAATPCRAALPVAVAVAAACKCPRHADAEAMSEWRCAALQWSDRRRTRGCTACRCPRRLSTRALHLTGPIGTTKWTRMATMQHGGTVRVQMSGGECSAVQWRAVLGCSGVVQRIGWHRLASSHRVRRRPPSGALIPIAHMVQCSAQCSSGCQCHQRQSPPTTVTRRPCKHARTTMHVQKNNTH